jgi:PAS domain-containing protein
VVDAIPTLPWSARSDGSADFFNQRWLDYTGLSAEQARDWGWTVALHSDDVNPLVLWAIASGYWRTLAGGVLIGLVVPWRMPPMPAAALEKPCK